jgi:uncharacterized membrane protein
MGRHTRGIKAARSSSHAQIEHTEVFDDNLLPDATEIAKLQQLDPDIVNWLKARAEKEQDFRHDAFNRRLGLVDNHNKRDHYTGRMALVIYLVLVGSCVAASFVLVRENHALQGSMFGGAAIILALAVLITRRKPKEPE